MKAIGKVSTKTKWIAAAAVSLMAAAAIGLSGCGGSSSSSSSSDVPEKYKDLDSVTLILADNTSKGAAGNLWSQAVADKAKEITGGKLNVDYHGTGELGGDGDCMRQVQSGDIAMFVGQPAPMVSFVGDLAAFDLPMAFATYDADQIENALNGDNEFTQKLQASYEAAGLHNLGWLQNGTYRQTTANKDLSTLADFKGFQIRTMQNSNHMAFWTAIGAEPTPLAWSETYFALQNGTVDGQENAVDTCVGASLQEVQKYLAKTNHILYTNNICINKDTWDSLDPAYQEALTQAISEATDSIRPQMADLESTNLKTMQDAGVQVIEYDDSFFNEILNMDSVKKVYTDIDSQTNGLSTTLVNVLKASK